MRKLYALLVTLAFLLVPSALPAQSLSEAAKKEKERRKMVKDGKSFTEDDLRRAGDGYAASPTEETSATAAGAPKEGEGAKKAEEKSEEELKSEANTAWRKKLDQAQQDVTRYTEEVNKIQLDLNDTSGGFYTARRNTLISLLEDSKKKLAAAQQQVADLEDQGRKSGYR